MTAIFMIQYKLYIYNIIHVYNLFIHTNYMHTCVDITNSIIVSIRNNNY